MASKRFPLETKIYVTPDESELRLIRRPDGISFGTTIAQEGDTENRPGTIAVELHLTNQLGTLLITMRRVARKPDSWYCTTSSIRLPPRAATDLVRSLTSITKGLKP